MWRDIIVPRFHWQEISAAGTEEPTNEGAPRFVVELSATGQSRVVVYTDRLGVFQAFVEAP